MNGFASFIASTGIADMFADTGVVWWKTVLMLAIACVLL